LNTDYERIWLQQDDAWRVREAEIGGSLEVTFTVFWSPKEFALIEAIPKEPTFDL
jgi:hypothetical protein